jgi:hypothetical protein
MTELWARRGQSGRDRERQRERQREHQTQTHTDTHTPSHTTFIDASAPRFHRGAHASRCIRPLLSRRGWRLRYQRARHLSRSPVHQSAHMTRVVASISRRMCAAGGGLWCNRALARTVGCLDRGDCAEPGGLFQVAWLAFPVRVMSCRACSLRSRQLASWT